MSVQACSGPLSSGSLRCIGHRDYISQQDLTGGCSGCFEKPRSERTVSAPKPEPSASA